MSPGPGAVHRRQQPVVERLGAWPQESAGSEQQLPVSFCSDPNIRGGHHPLWTLRMIQGGGGGISESSDVPRTADATSQAPAIDSGLAQSYTLHWPP